MSMFILFIYMQANSFTIAFVKATHNISTHFTHIDVNKIMHVTLSKRQLCDGTKLYVHVVTN